MNNGLGVTSVSTWHDRLFFSTSNRTGWLSVPPRYASNNYSSPDNRIVPVTRSHRGILPVGGSYTESISFRVPNAIHGTFFFIIVTDIFDNVYENIFNNDNTNSTQVENYGVTNAWLGCNEVGNQLVPENNNTLL